MNPAEKRSRGLVIGYWIATALFCLQIGFTAFAQLKLPQVSQAFAHLGFPPYFRVELSWEEHAAFRWALVKVDVAGKELGRVVVPTRERARIR